MAKVLDKAATDIVPAGMQKRTVWVVAVGAPVYYHAEGTNGPCLYYPKSMKTQYPKEAGKEFMVRLQDYSERHMRIAPSSTWTIEGIRAYKKQYQEAMKAQGLEQKSDIQYMNEGRERPEVVTDEDKGIVDHGPPEMGPEYRDPSEPVLVSIQTPRDLLERDASAKNVGTRRRDPPQRAEPQEMTQ